MAKTSPRNLGDGAFLESQEGLTINIQNSFVKFVAHRVKWRFLGYISSYHFAKKSNLMFIVVLVLESKGL